MYQLTKKNKKGNLSEEINFTGFTFKNKKNKLKLINEELSQKYIKEKHLTEFEKIFTKILLFLEEGNNEEDGVLLLDELARVYSNFEQKYADYISKKELNKINRKVRLLASELKKFKYIKNIQKEAPTSRKRR